MSLFFDDRGKLVDDGLDQDDIFNTGDDAYSGNDDSIRDDGDSGDDYDTDSDIYYINTSKLQSGIPGFDNDLYDSIDDADDPFDTGEFDDDEFDPISMNGMDNFSLQDWLMNFNPDDAYDDDIIGTPGDDMENWHMQAYNDTCALVSEGFVLEGIYGVSFSEDDLRREAIDNGWYVPGGGTPMECIGKVLEAYGIEIKKDFDCDLNDIYEKLSYGMKVIVTVDTNEIWCQGMDAPNDICLEDFMGIPDADTNHAVEVIGIDKSDPYNPMVILNDPEHPEGQGLMVPAGSFMDAWENAYGYMVSTTESS